MLSTRLAARLTRFTSAAGAPSAPTRLPIRGEAVVVAMAVLAALVLRSITGDLLAGAFNDDGVYIALGKAIAEGDGYRSIHLVGQPVHTKYPPGLPALLAVFWLLSGSLSAVHALGVAASAAATAAAAGLLWWLARARLGLHRALVAGFVVGPILLDASTQYFTLVIGEPYFLLGWAGALVLDERLRRAHAVGPDMARAVALGLCLAAATLVRTQFVVVAAAVLVPLIATRPLRRAGLAALASCAAPLALWRVWHGAMVARGPVAVQPDESYAAFVAAGVPGETVRRLAASIATNIVEYGAILGAYLSGITWLSIVLGAVGAALALVGARRLARQQPALPLGLCLNGLVVLLWPFTQDRLVLVLLPVAGMLAAVGARAALDRAQRARPYLGAALAAGALLVAARQETLRRDGNGTTATGAGTSVVTPRVFLRQVSRYEYAVSRWLLTHTTSRDRVVVTAPAAIFLYTGRLTIPSEPVEGRFADSMYDVPGRYLAARILEDGATIVIHERRGGRSARELAGVMARCPGALRSLGAFVEGRLPHFYAVVPGNGCLHAAFGEGAAPHPGAEGAAADPTAPRA